MKLVFKKGFDGDVNKLPSREVEGSVVFKEPESIKKFSIIANSVGIVLMAAALVPIFVISGGFFKVFDKNYLQFLLAFLLCVIIMPLHELFHAICFKEEVEFYTAIKRGILFVVGTESMSKGRFIFMSLLPNLVFGFIPYILFFIFPSQLWLGLLGAINIGSGAGDYINVFNALTQMPKGAKCFMSKNRSYWYMEK